MGAQLEPATIPGVGQMTGAARRRDSSGGKPYSPGSSCS
jgi:hypothetical protein